MDEIAREQQRVVGHGDGGNFQVHRPDAAQAGGQGVKDIRRLHVEREDNDPRERLQRLQRREELLIRMDLIAPRLPAVDLNGPALRDSLPAGLRLASGQGGS